MGMPYRLCIVYWIRGYVGSVSNVCYVCCVGSVCNDRSLRLKVSALSAMSAVPVCVGPIGYAVSV